MKRLIDKFFAKIFPEPNSGCHLWSGAADGCGYGVLSTPYRKHLGECKAHRLAYFLHNGEHPGEKHVLHKCDNPYCVNPEHLFLGTHSDNMRDCSRKGRMVRGRGQMHWAVKVSDETARMIFLDKSKPGEAARRFGATVDTVYAIRGGRADSWKWLRDEMASKDGKDITPEKP